MATVNGTHRAVIFPVFKFQRPEHSITMRGPGNIHLSKISAFRSHQQGGQIHDSAEGIIRLFEPMDLNGFHQFQYRAHELRLNDAFIYCATSNLVSQSLVWAINDGKTSCVLLTDVDEVMRRVSTAVPELSFIGFGRCIYRPKTLFVLPSDAARESRQAELQIPWIKPVEYSAQLEARGVWFPRQYPTKLTSINRDIPLRDLCIPVSYSGMYPFFEDHNRSLVIKVEVFGADRPTCLSMQYPNEVMSPVIHKQGDRYFLGFTSSSAIDFGGVDTQRTILGSTPLEQVESIRYSVEE